MALPMSPLLPQNDPDSSERKNELLREQEKYRYNYTYLPPLAMSNSVPFDDYPTLDWFLLVGKSALDVLINTIETDLDSERANRHRGILKELRELLSHPNAAAVEDMIREALARIEAGLSKGDPSSLKDYNRLFEFIALPGHQPDLRARCGVRANASGGTQSFGHRAGCRP